MSSASKRDMLYAHVGNPPAAILGFVLHVLAYDSEGCVTAQSVAPLQGLQQSEAEASARLLLASAHSQMHIHVGAAFGAAQMRNARKAELQTQRRAEKAAREAAHSEKEQRSYSHLMQVHGHAFSLSVRRLLSETLLPLVVSDMFNTFCRRPRTLIGLLQTCKPHNREGAEVALAPHAGTVLTRVMPRT